MRIGAHLSVSGSLEGAAERADRIGANTIQIFTSSPRTWRGAKIDPNAALRFTRARDRYDIKPLVVHANYLINLASADDEVWRKSTIAFREELQRSLHLGVNYVVVHPGSSKNQTVEQAMDRFAAAIQVAARGLKSDSMAVLLEITAGQGKVLGARWQELTEIRRLSQDRVGFPIAYCLDTAHCFASGVDFFEAAEALGIEHIPVIHTNDSKAAWESRVDRHEFIGRGLIGEPFFHRLLTDPRFRDKAFILETPFEDEGDDMMQIEILRRLSVG